MNNVHGQNTHECFLLHVTDELTKDKFLVDGGALLSILPPTPQQRLQGANDIKLRAANGSDIACFGYCSRTIKIGTQSFSFNFIIADVQCRILGADFLAANYLAPNHKDAQLINLYDYSTLPAEHAQGLKSNPINFVNHINDPYYSLLDKYPDITTPSFTLKDPQHGVRHHIPTSGNPVQSRARRLDPEKLAVAKAELEKLVDLGIAYRGKSEWSSPLLVTTKPNGGWRVCGDYRRLNNQTVDDRYPVRSLMDFTADLHGKSIFSKIDLMKGYHQIPVADADVRKTAVITPFGLFIFPRTPFGLKNAGQDFQRLMDAILGDLPRVYVYIDDILVASESKEQHLEDLESVFKTLSANGLVVQRSKCVLGVSSLEFLGYHVDANGIAPLPDRVKAIRATTPPTTIKELQRFLGMVGYYRRFIPKAAMHLFHLFEALKGKPKILDWTRQCQESFDATKEALAKATLLFHPRPGAQLALTTDASNTAVGGVLEQRGPLGWEPLAFYSSKLKPNEVHWPPYDRELLGAFKGIRHFRDMVEGRPFTLYTDHQSLIPSLSKITDSHTARQRYQLSCIAEYTTDIRYVQGKANLVADALSRPNEAVPDASSTSRAALPQQQQQQQTATRPTLLDLSTTVCPANSSQPPSVNLSNAQAQRTAACQAKRDAAAADVQMVVNSIGQMGIDWNEVARQQPLDPEFKKLRDDERSGLNFMSICIGTQNLIVDVSNGPARPYIPYASRRRVFEVFHGLGHPGVERTRQSISKAVVWPSMRQDVTKWARECIPCQRSKVTKHVIPPIGEFQVPNRRFQHINMDIVILPESNGFKYLLTAVDRFSRWPVAIPIQDMTAESVIDAFSHGWVQHFGVPVTITTDRGAQFSSDMFTQLTKTWGIKCNMTAAYHPEANGLVERFHRRLKESLIALGTDSPNEWYWRLPCVMLSIRTTLKPDLGASPADLVFGEQLAIPGEALPANPSTEDQLVRQRAAALADLRVEVARLQPVPTSAHRTPIIHLPQELETCTHIFVRRGGIKANLSSPYVGPFRVISRDSTNFKIAVPGRPNETIAINRVKPCLSTIEDAEEAEPDPPRRPGRPPRPPKTPPTPRQQLRRRCQSRGQQNSPAYSPTPSPRVDDDEDSPAARRNHRRRHGNQAEDFEDQHPQSPPRSPPTPVPIVPNPPSPTIQDTTTDWSPPAWYADDSDPEDELPTSPRLHLHPEPVVDQSQHAPDSPTRPQQRGDVDWFSPPPPPPPPPPPQRRRKKRVGNPNWVKGGTFDGAYQFGHRKPDKPDVNALSQQARSPNTRLFDSRKRPDVNALNQLIREHLDSNVSPTNNSFNAESPISDFQNFFPSISH